MRWLSVVGLLAMLGITVRGQSPLQAQADHFVQGRDTLPYRLYRPANVGQARLPLVLFLHGAGERGNDNLAQLRHVVPRFLAPELQSRHPAYVLAPQCPADSAWADILRVPGKVYLQDPRLTTPARQVLALLDEVLRREAVDPDRVYVIGISMGGFGTLRLAQTAPQRFAAAIAVCGGGDTTQAARLKQLPVWLFHGTADSVVPVARSQEMYRAIRAAGGPVVLTLFPGIDHDSWSLTFGDDPRIYDWLFAQRRR